VGGGANTCACAGIAMPGGAIPGAEVGEMQTCFVAYSRSRCGTWVLHLLSLRCVWCCGRGWCGTCGVAVAVIARVRCCGRRRRAVSVACGCRSPSLRRVGVTVAVFVPRVVSQSPSVRRVGVAVGVACGCRRRRLCAACSVVGAIIAPRMVSWVPSLRRVWCCSCYRRATRGVAGAVFAPHVVSRSPSLHRVLCRGCRRCVMRGVVVAVIAPRVVLWALRLGCASVMVAVFAPHVVSGVPSLRRMGCCGHCCHATHGVCSHEGHGNVAHAAVRGAVMGRARLGGARQWGRRS